MAPAMLPLAGTVATFTTVDEVSETGIARTVLAPCCWFDWNTTFKILTEYQ